jgi:hypothetical protein
MRLTWLGWAGAELEAAGATVVVDPLEDAGAVFAPLGEQAAATPRPKVVPPSAGTAVAGLVTHLHRDHADAKALAAALAPGATVLEPLAGGGDALEELALAQAEHELAALPRATRSTASISPSRTPPNASPPQPPSVTCRSGSSTPARPSTSPPPRPTTQPATRPPSGRELESPLSPERNRRTQVGRTTCKARGKRVGRSVLRRRDGGRRR